MYQMSIMLLCTAYEPIAQMATISGVRIANGMRRIAAKKGTNARTISTPMMLPVYMLAMSPQTKSGFSVKRSGPGWSPQMMRPPSMTAAVEEPDDRHDEVEPFHEVDEAERHPELTGDDVEAHGGEDEPEDDGHQRLQRIAAAEPDEAREGQELDREELRRAEAQGDLREKRREEGDQHDREEGADE